MIRKTISLEELGKLVSFDHGCLVGSLSRDSYVEQKHVDTFVRLRDDISRNGITTPLRVVGTKLVDGHHRAVIALELGIDEIPINYEGVL